MFASSGGVADEAFVVIPAHVEAEQERIRIREEFETSISECPECGGQRFAVKSWRGDCKPAVKCHNDSCPKRPPRIWQPNMW